MSRKVPPYFTPSHCHESINYVILAYFQEECSLNKYHQAIIQEVITQAISQFILHYAHCGKDSFNTRRSNW
jgi:hypothetical protein